jgi:hypothetical protein
VDRISPSGPFVSPVAEVRQFGRNLHDHRDFSEVHGSGHGRRAKLAPEHHREERPGFDDRIFGSVASRRWLGARAATTEHVGANDLRHASGRPGTDGFDRNVVGVADGYSYQWERCDTSGAACSAIAGAASSTYLLQATDVGSTLRVAVTASSNAGSTVAVSSQTSTVSTAPAPAPAPNPTVQTYTFSGSLNPKNTSRSFPVSVGAGITHAELSFSKCSSLGLSVHAGSSISASKNGPSVVVLDANLAAGSYTYEVSGGRCSFTLTVTAPGR